MECQLSDVVARSNPSGTPLPEFDLLADEDPAILDLAKRQYEEEQTRWNQVDEKARTLLTVAGLLVPITAGMAPFLSSALLAAIGLALLVLTTFIILQIRNQDGCFQLSAFDSPPPVFLSDQRVQRLQSRREVVAGKALILSEGVLRPGDFLGLMSDGVLYANRGVTRDAAWGWDEVAAFLGKAAVSGPGSAEFLVRAVMRETQRRYGQRVGDDATFVGVLARKPRRLMVFTGPPADRKRDEACVHRLLGFEGRRVVCGGTTAGIVAEYSGEVLRTDTSTTREGIPPIGILPDVDLVTEGIVTMARTLELLQASGGDPERLPVDRNGAVLLARELLQADSVFFLAGESVNPYYQNPQLPRSVSIRRSLVMQLVEALKSFQKVATVEWT